MEKVFKNKFGHEYIIIKDNYRLNGYTVVDVRFIETGTQRTVRRSVAVNGEVKDHYAKDICGVACKGSVKTSVNKKAYSIWKNMIQRCYSKNNKSYRFYGGIGVFVDDRWLCYENFLSDLMYIDGYNEEEFNKGILQLDKDSKEDGNKVYSLEKCKFITKKENIKLSNKVNRNRNKPRHIILVKDKEGAETVVYNIPEFAKEMGLIQSKIYECLNGNRKTHKGFTFKKIGENKYE